jgi:hypothetical protein
MNHTRTFQTELPDSANAEPTQLAWAQENDVTPSRQRRLSGENGIAFPMKRPSAGKITGLSG